MKLMRAKDWAKKRFAPDSLPSARVIRKWCEEGSIPSKKIGGLWFVDIEAESLETGNELVDQVLNG